jgi:hypothetical protein
MKNKIQKPIIDCDDFSATVTDYQIGLKKHDKEKGTYVRYQVYKDNDNTSANSSTASAFGNANSGIMFAIGILAGGLVGGILTYFIVRRKKRVNID